MDDAPFPFLHYMIISYIYSILISFFIIKYFRKKERTNFFVKLITTFHLSLFFFIAPLALISSIPEKFSNSIEVNSDATKRLIEIISYINYFLSYILYPLIEIYIKSGYFSLCNILRKVSLKVYIFKYSKFLMIIIVPIIYIIFKDYLIYFYKNVLIFILNYLNILKLMSIYFNVGFCYGAIPRYYYKTFSRKKEYTPYILGKIYFDEIKIKNKFRKQYNKILRINLENNQNIIIEKNEKKYEKIKKEIKAFIEEVNSTENLENLKNIDLDNENDNENNQIININDLELKLGNLSKNAKI